MRGRRPGRILRAAGLLAMLLAAFAATGASAYPRIATAWLGTWASNQGTVEFTQVSGCRSGPTFIDGKVCYLTGIWHRPGHGWTAIHGYVPVGKKYKGETWEG